MPIEIYVDVGKQKPTPKATALSKRTNGTSGPGDRRRSRSQTAKRKRVFIYRLH